MGAFDVPPYMGRVGFRLAPAFGFVGHLVGVYPVRPDEFLEEPGDLLARLEESASFGGRELEAPARRAGRH